MRRTKGGKGGGGGRFGIVTSPAGALAHLPCCHTNGGTIRVGLRDGRGGFFFRACFTYSVGSPGKGALEGRAEGEGEGRRCEGRPNALILSAKL